MIPKLDYQMHDLLIQIFMPPLENKKDFYKQNQEFIQHFKKIEKKVLISIEKFSGFRWSKKIIPVYMIPNGGIPSFAKSNLEENTPGVVQRIYGTNKRATHILIHELTHINQFQSDFHSKSNSFIFDKKGVKNYMRTELCSDIVCIHVLRDLFGNKSSYEADYWNFQNNVRTSSPGIEKKIPIYLKKWNLNKKTLREYILK